MKIIRILLVACLLFPAAQLSAQSTDETSAAAAPAFSGGCFADFNWVDSLGYTFFYSSSTLGNAGVYLWDFGDGNYSMQQHPSNTYAVPGLYTVCLIVLDSMQNFCDSTCHYVTVTTVSSLPDNKTDAAGVSLSPNPSDESAAFSFFMAQPGDASISVYDITGREIMKRATEQFSAGKQTTTINTQQFAPGTYFVQLIVNGQLSKSRLIVSHR